jgi:hypothetical protein
MIKREYLNNYYLSMESQRYLFFKADDFRFTRKILKNKFSKHNISMGFLGAVVILLGPFLLYR